MSTHTPDTGVPVLAWQAAPIVGPFEEGDVIGMIESRIKQLRDWEDAEFVRPSLRRQSRRSLLRKGTLTSKGAS